jgi:cobaltochelatase CobN
MLAHKHHGGQQLAARLENLIGLAATTGQVDNLIFDHITDEFILNERRRKQIADNNRFALLEIIERLLEARSRGYWEADRDRLERLEEAFLEAEADIEEESEKWAADS